MATEELARLRALVEQALERAPDARGPWLDGACGGDAALRERVDGLLRHALLEDGFLRPLPSPGAPTGLSLGTEVGPYRLTRVLGAGGMGTVYEAEQDAPRRRVALKVMQGGALPPSARHRFRHEVEILASLRHPCIAQVYEAGVLVHDAREVPWFAMEFVEDARTIVEHARQAALGRDAMLRLFAEVCDAVHHGHSRGIIHRDLKPGNILVDADGRPKLIDFGVARAADDAATMLTGMGEVVGTLSYMSPEQLLGDRLALDTRTDVYSLGVVLHQMLTGELPYELGARDLVTVARIIRETPPRRPGALRADLKGDPETILLKCLEKEPDRRYASADALGGDLRRFLAREPIVAHPPSVAYQLRMFARRNRALVASACVVLAAAVAATAVSVRYAVRAGRSEEVAVARGEEAEEQRDRARQLLGTVLDRSLAATSRHVPRVQNLPGGGPVARTMTEEALQDLEAILAFDDADYVKGRLIDAYLKIGELQGDPMAVAESGEHEAAIRSYRRALELATELRAADPSNPFAEHLYGLALLRLGRLEARDDREAGLGKIGEGTAVLEELRRRCVKGSVDPEDMPLRNVLAGLAAAHHAQVVLAAAPDAARPHLQAQLELNEEIVRRWPDAMARFGLARARLDMGGGIAAAGGYREALGWYEAGLAMLNSLVEEDPDNAVYLANVGSADLRLARCMGALARYEEADRLMNDSRDVFLRLHEMAPDNLSFARELGNSWYWVARSAEACAEAEPTERRAHLERAAHAYLAASGIWSKTAAKDPRTRSAADRARRHHDRVRAALGDD